MRYIILSPVACPAVPVCTTLSDKRQYFSKISSWTFSLQLLSETSVIRERIQRDSTINVGRPDSTINVGRPDSTINIGRPDSTINVGRPDGTINVGRPDSTINVGRSSCKIPVTIFSTGFRRSTQISHFVKFRAVGADRQTDRRTDRQTWQS